MSHDDRTASSDVWLRRLIRCTLTPDGKSLRLEFELENSISRSLMIPISGVPELLSALQASKVIHRGTQAQSVEDPELEVFPLSSWRLDDWLATEKYILTLASSVGFELAFSADKPSLMNLAAAIGEIETTDKRSRRRLDS
jgi:hypothetical protein